MKKRSFVCILLIIVLMLNIAFKINYIDRLEMNAYQIESSKINYVFFDTIYINDSRSYNLKSILGDNKEIQQVFCIWKDTIYLSYQYTRDSFLHWCIASVNLNDLKLNTIVDEVFDSANYETFSTYQISFDENFYGRTGYYYDKKIIITNFKKLIQYDVKNDNYNILEYENYIKPRLNITCDIENYQKVIFYQGAKTVVIDKMILSQKSEVARDIISSNGNYIWDGSSSMSYFFDSVKVVDDNIYLIVRVLNFLGETYAIVFNCDLEDETYSYVGWHRTIDIINDNEFYIVPEIK